MKISRPQCLRGSQQTDVWVTILMNLTVLPLMLVWTVLSIILFPALFPVWKITTRWNGGRIMRQMIWLYGRGWLAIMAPFVRFSREGLDREEIKPIIGTEVETGRADRLVLLVRNDIGYRNLCNIISRRKRQEKVSVGAETAHLFEGLILLSSSETVLKQSREFELMAAADLGSRPTEKGSRLRKLAAVLAPAKQLAPRPHGPGTLVVGVTENRDLRFHANSL